MSEEVIYDVEVGGTRSVLSAERNIRGSLVIAGQDLGRAPNELFGDSDYEYWITIPPRYAKDIDIATLREVANDEPGGSRAIRAWLEERGVRFRLGSYMLIPRPRVAGVGGMH